MKIEDQIALQDEKIDHLDNQVLTSEKRITRLRITFWTILLLLVLTSILLIF